MILFVLDMCLILNSNYNKFVCVHLVVFGLNCVISEILRSYNHANTFKHHIGVVIKLVDETVGHKFKFWSFQRLNGKFSNLDHDQERCEQ